MNDAPWLSRCLECGAKLPLDAAERLCSACLNSAAVATPAAPQSMGDETIIIAPSAEPGSNVAGPRPLPLTGQFFGPYRIERLLGRGGMGEVYEAEHVEYGRRVALKLLSQRLTDPQDRARFLREGQLAASITHPNCVYIFGSEEIGGTPVISMELLPGGTLKERVQKGGPLPPPQAVDAILQVITGLEAAQAGGILHRDIKPGNCFIDSDESVKIGDFGLSISTMARDVTRITRTGTIQGTPQFAAPEQLRGDPLDVRSDIYAVGATLYYLLTGDPPFDDTDLMVLLTRVVTEVPRSPRDAVRTVPRGLAAILLRCLAKDRASRPPTYAALDEALRPFSSTAPTAATLGTRVAAGVIDQMLVLFLVTVTISLIRVISGTSGSPSLVMAAYFILMATYFTLTEGLTGASVGKWMLGLRVTDVEGGRPGLVRASVRSALFVLAALGPFVIWNGPWSFVTVLLAPFALFLTARRRHGFAGLHEILSGTRATAYAHEAKMGMSRTVPSHQLHTGQTRAHALGLPMRGPFVLLESFESTASAAVVLGFDPVLKRRVWIREAPIGTPLADAARRDLARPGRLRWLAGQQRPNGTWEAFEAPGGASLISRIATKQPWGCVRQWLADLAGELFLCRRDRHVPTLGLNRVWITPEGHAKLLDFPAPGTAEPDSDSAEARTDDPRNIEAFLGRVAWSSLLGRVQDASDALPITQPPLPSSGTAVLRALHQPRDLQDLLDVCRLALHTPSHVTRRSRALLPAMIAVAVFCGIAFVPFSSWRNFARSLGPVGVNQDNRALFNGLVGIEGLRRSGVPESNPERRALEVYVAGRYAPLSVFASSFSGALRPYRELANDIATRHPTVSDGDLLAALKQLGQDRLDRLNLKEPAESVLASVLPVSVLLLSRLAGLGYCSLVLAFLLRGGLTIRLFNLAVVDAAGAEITRWRALLRAAVAWTPLIALQLVVKYASIALGAHPTAGWTIVGALCLIIAVGMCWGIVVPERGLHDRIAGTWLTPR